MVKKRGVVWNYYNKKMVGSQVIAFCKFCNQSYIQNATRMERHMERCSKCPDNIRQRFIQMAYNKRQKTGNLDNKINNTWPKHESSGDQNIIDTEMDNLYDWNYRNQSYSDKASNEIHRNVDMVIPNNEQTWVNLDNIVQNNDVDTSSVNRTCETNQSDAGSDIPAQPQELMSSAHQRKSYIPRRISQWPVSSLRTINYSPLQSKICQEQLLERCALRRVAELEVQRKTLELERFQWEYERDKVQTEVRWAHETRMMQLKEERERQLIEQCRTTTVSHVV